MDVYDIDQNPASINEIKTAYPTLPADRFQLCPVEHLQFENNFFDHVISSAVLHFANSTSQFQNMLTEMLRVLKPGGTLFIRMTTDIRIEDKVKPIGDGVSLPLLVFPKITRRTPRLVFFTNRTN